uniref:Uncharacterized protein n=1 Tax=Rhizophora mucronata TaxID=61149 RepID=A0A2P2NT21_RHIMU
MVYMPAEFGSISAEAATIPFLSLFLVIFLLQPFSFSLIVRQTLH